MNRRKFMKSVAAVAIGALAVPAAALASRPGHSSEWPKIRKRWLKKNFGTINLPAPHLFVGTAIIENAGPSPCVVNETYLLGPNVRGYFTSDGKEWEMTIAG